MKRITEKQLSILAVSLIGLFASIFFSNYLPLVVSTIIVLIVEFTNDKAQPKKERKR